jgi:hypothetical protein
VKEPGDSHDAANGANGSHGWKADIRVWCEKQEILHGASVARRACDKYRFPEFDVIGHRRHDTERPGRIEFLQGRRPLVSQSGRGDHGLLTRTQASGLGYSEIRFGSENVS